MDTATQCLLTKQNLVIASVMVSIPIAGGAGWNMVGDVFLLTLFLNYIREVLDIFKWALSEEANL